MHAKLHHGHIVHPDQQMNIAGPFLLGFPKKTDDLRLLSGVIVSFGVVCDLALLQFFQFVELDPLDLQPGVLLKRAGNL